MFTTIDKIGMGIVAIEGAIALIIGGLCYREASRIVENSKKKN